MRLLVLGHSRVARKRVLPAARASGLFSHVAVASRRGRGAPSADADESFGDYEVALSNSGADLVYVSLRNAEHAGWVERALDHDYHVIVDKPAFTGLADAERLVALAAAKQRCLAESTVFPFHPQIARAQSVFRKLGIVPTRVVALFSFPPLPAGDFRYDPALGGGAFHDLGPYVAATSRVFVGDRVERLSVEALSRSETGVETAFSLMLTYGNGRSLIGHFGFDTEYVNRIHLLAPGASVELQPAFTIPSDLPARLRIRVKDQEREECMPAADAFACFLRTTVEAVETGNWADLGQILLEDARLRRRIETAAEEA
jgi:dTDP-3,4-didehydro-2,6-dideoxy-alpha-D-glucose 3-reductase